MAVVLLSGCDTVGTRSIPPGFDPNTVEPYELNIPSGYNMGSGFFPLQVGLTWKYRNIDTLDISAIMPDFIETKVVGTEERDGREYYVVKNLFLKDTINTWDQIDPSEYARVRVKRGNVYMHREGSDQTLYLFSRHGLTWRRNLPSFGIAEGIDVRADLVRPSGELAAVAWDWPGFFGAPDYSSRAESWYGDVFVKGVGRTRIFTLGQIPRGTWDLVEVFVDE